MLDKDLIIFDLETSGKDPKTCSIIQLGAVQFLKTGYITNEVFSVYIKPYTNTWEEEAQGIHKIDIFKPRIIYKILLDTAGQVILKDYNIEYEINGGSPIQSAYNEAFRLAITLKIPLYEEISYNEYKLLYHPDNFIKDEKYLS